jgi:ATP-dependent RNA helicase RhlE
MTFEDLGLAEPILRAISTEGYSEPTPIQAESIPHIIAGTDLQGCAQTGTGKTAAFALPILHRLLEKPLPPEPKEERPPQRGPSRYNDRSRGNDRRRQNERPRGPVRKIRCLVLSPTRELALQIAESFRTYGRHTDLRQTVVYGGVGQVPQVRALERGVDILVATPGRLCDLMNQGYIDISAVEMFVLDEADRMLDMGFLPDLRRVTDRLPKERQTLLFSATMPTAIQQLANDILSDPVKVRIEPRAVTTDLIEQSICFVAKHEKSNLLAHWIETLAIDRAVVFVRTKHGADRVAKHLEKAGIRAEAMHGDKSQAARQRTLASFKSKNPPVLVATDVAARGLDVDGVTHVFNYDLPREADTYVHRIGRTGRAGAAGRALSFCDHEDHSLLAGIERRIACSLKQETEHPFLAEDLVEMQARRGSSRDSQGSRPARRGRGGPPRQGGGGYGGGRYGGGSRGGYGGGGQGGNGGQRRRRTRQASGSGSSGNG